MKKEKASYVFWLKAAVATISKSSFFEASAAFFTIERSRQEALAVQIFPQIYQLHSKLIHVHKFMFNIRSFNREGSVGKPQTQFRLYFMLRRICIHNGF